MKRLADAERDGDPIRAVLRASAVNHNGKASAASISYPGVDGQASVMAEAYRRGGDLDPLMTGYFECHGTGTAVGDPIEVEAISIASKAILPLTPGPRVIYLGGQLTSGLQ